MADIYIRPETVFDLIRHLGLTGWDVPYNAIALQRNRACREVGRWLEFANMTWQEWEEEFTDELMEESEQIVTAVRGTLFRFYPMAAGFPEYSGLTEGVYADELPDAEEERGG